MSTILTPPTVIPPVLDPLKNIYEANDLEVELKAAFMEVFQDTLRDAERRINTYGIPHRGTFATVQRFVRAAGLSLENRASREAYMAELFRAWVAQNPRRGSAFLQTYLQLLWPNQWSLVQLWHDPADTYPPSGGGEQPGFILTSRLRLSLEADDQGQLAQVVGSFRSVLPAKMVLEITLRRAFAGNLRVANAFMGGQFQEFAGTMAP